MTRFTGTILVACLGASTAWAQAGPVWSQLELDGIKAAGHIITQEQLRSHEEKRALLEYLCASVASHVRGNINQGFLKFDPWKFIDLVTKVCKLGHFGRPSPQPKPKPKKKSFWQRLKDRMGGAVPGVKVSFSKIWTEIKTQMTCSTIVKYVPSPLYALSALGDAIFDLDPNGVSFQMCMQELHAGLVCSIPDLIIDAAKMAHAVFFSAKNWPLRERCLRFTNPVYEWTRHNAFLRVTSGLPTLPFFMVCSIGSWALKKLGELIRCFRSSRILQLLLTEIFKLGCNILGGLIIDLAATALTGGATAAASIAKWITKAMTLLGKGNPSVLLKLAEISGQALKTKLRDAGVNAAVVGAMNSLKATQACGEVLSR